MPRDMGLQTEIGRTFKGGSAALPEESRAPTTNEGEEEAPTFRILPRAGGNPLASSEVSVSPPLLLCQHLQEGPKFSPCRLCDKGLLNRR